jgi:transcription antitermination factor NusG
MRSCSTVIGESLLASTQLRLDELSWYAIHTRSRHEKKVDAALREIGIRSFLPLTRQVRRWSDRQQVVELPLFPCYGFLQIEPSSKTRLTVLRTPGVLGFVGARHGPSPIPNAEIEQVRKVLEQSVPVSPYPFLRVGQRVRIRGGALDGVEGIWQGQKSNGTLVISVSLIQRSFAISIDGYAVEPV